MFRGTTARAVLPLLAALLLALPFFAPASSFAHAHTVRQAEAKTPPGIKLSGKAKRDEITTFRDCDRPGGLADPLRSRDRHRTGASAAPTPQEPERALLELDPAAAHQPAPPGAPHDRPSRSSAAHSPAALQVFRC
ncbi:hypothetical protein JHN59_30200 [Streptomyces sp. MBT49]|uniref:hypothetical protein n=1 Tax=Streptomyces sp. MBT49 TaxID=1488380 RepID=UPI00190D368B|nr:hypothetical protein [Streptomyces sp. MBT49]MBK3629021.1 hypothetical protein [Streptomyces sp. MBT49]